MFSCLSRQSSETSKTVEVKNEKIFEKFLDFPEETRMAVVDEMQADDRCRFRRCSRLSDKEAKASKKFLVSELHLRSNQNYMQIEVIHGDYKKMEERHGYILEISDIAKKEIVECKKLDYTVVWKVELDEYLLQNVIGRFENYLQLHQKTLKKLIINAPDVKDHCFEIDRLNRLEELTLHRGADIQGLLSKIPHPLKALCGSEKFGNQNLAECEHIYQVENCLISHHTMLNNDQFFRLSAPFVSIHIGHLTERNILDLVRAWQCGPLLKPIERYEWRLTRSNFNIWHLFNLMGVVYNGLSRTKTIQVNQFYEHGKRAKLTFKKFVRTSYGREYVTNEQLVFSVLKN